MIIPDDLLNWYYTILPKLEHIANSGDGAVIHEINAIRGRLLNWVRLVERESRVPLTGEIDSYKKHLAENLKRAEEFLINYANK